MRRGTGRQRDGGDAGRVPRFRGGCFAESRRGERHRHLCDGRQQRRLALAAPAQRGAELDQRSGELAAGRRALELRDRLEE
jgi:hypothetical protein